MLFQRVLAGAVGLGLLLQFHSYLQILESVIVKLQEKSAEF